MKRRAKRTLPEEVEVSEIEGRIAPAAAAHVSPVSGRPYAVLRLVLVLESWRWGYKVDLVEATIGTDFFLIGPGPERILVRAADANLEVVGEAKVGIVTDASVVHAPESSSADGTQEVHPLLRMIRSCGFWQEEGDRTIRLVRYREFLLGPGDDAAVRGLATVERDPDPDALASYRAQPMRTLVTAPEGGALSIRKSG